MSKQVNNFDLETYIVLGVDDWGNDTVFGIDYNGKVGFYPNRVDGYTPFEFGEHGEAVEKLEEHGYEYDGIGIKIVSDY